MPHGAAAVTWLNALLTGAGIGTAGVTLLAFFRLFGKGVGWLIDRGDRNGDKLAVRMGVLETRVEALSAKIVIVGGALAEAVAELRQHAPDSLGLARYERALRIAFPLTETPPDMAGMAAEIDRLNRGQP